MAAKFEFFQDKASEWRWRLKSANGQVIATGGEGYDSKAGAQNGIDAVKRDAPGHPSTRSERPGFTERVGARDVAAVTG